MLSQNKKIKQSSGDKYIVFNFGIPAFASTTGIRTCPLAGECKKGCYAQQGAYTWSNVSQAYERRLEETLAETFIDKMGEELNKKLKTAQRTGKQVVVRIHDSGDFYNRKYLNKWLMIIGSYPNVHFYAYTKMVPLFRRVKRYGLVPDNFTVIYSEGGQMDWQIDTETDRHARVFSSHEELLAAGYADATKNDLVAALGENNKIGLVYHGAKSKSWETNK